METPERPRRTVVGLIVPSSNRTIEETLARAALGRDLAVDFVVTRLAVRVISHDDSSRSQFSPDAMISAARLLGDAGPDVIAWAGTSGLWTGAETEKVLLGDLAAVAGCEATSSSQAVLAALAEQESRQIALLTPYDRRVHDLVREEFTEMGFETVAEQWLGLTDNAAFHDVATSVREDAVGHLGAGTGGSVESVESVESVDGHVPVVVVCTNLVVAMNSPAPVIDSLIATLWQSIVMGGAYEGAYSGFHHFITQRLNR